MLRGAGYGRKDCERDAMNSNWYVEIVSYETDKVIKRMGPMSRHVAEKVDDGVQHNLNHDQYFTRFAGDATGTTESKGDAP